MVFHVNLLPAGDPREISCLICYFLKKAAKFEIVVCCKLKVVLNGLKYQFIRSYSRIVTGKLYLNIIYLVKVQCHLVSGLVFRYMLCKLRKSEKEFLKNACHYTCTCILIEEECACAREWRCCFSGDIFRTFSNLKKNTFWLSFYYFLNCLILSYIVLALCTPYLNKKSFILIEISK